MNDAGGGYANYAQFGQNRVLAGQGQAKPTVFGTLTRSQSGDVALGMPATLGALNDTAVTRSNSTDYQASDLLSSLGKGRERGDAGGFGYGMGGVGLLSSGRSPADFSLDNFASMSGAGGLEETNGGLGYPGRYHAAAQRQQQQQQPLQQPPPPQQPQGFVLNSGSFPPLPRAEGAAAPTAPHPQASSAFTPPPPAESRLVDSFFGAGGSMLDHQPLQPPQQQQLMQRQQQQQQQLGQQDGENGGGGGGIGRPLLQHGGPRQPQEQLWAQQLPPRQPQQQQQQHGGEQAPQPQPSPPLRSYGQPEGGDGGLHGAHQLSPVGPATPMLQGRAPPMQQASPRHDGDPQKPPRAPPSPHMLQQQQQQHQQQQQQQQQQVASNGGLNDGGLGGYRGHEGRSLLQLSGPLSPMAAELGQGQQPQQQQQQLPPGQQPSPSAQPAEGPHDGLQGLGLHHYSPLPQGRGEQGERRDEQQLLGGAGGGGGQQRLPASPQHQAQQRGRPPATQASPQKPQQAGEQQQQQHQLEHLMGGGRLASAASPGPGGAAAAAGGAAGAPRAGGGAEEDPRATKYGLLGLLGVIRMTDPDLNMLALGSDLTTLGLNLDSSDVLYATFASPWADAPGPREPLFQLQLPACYYMQPPALKTAHLSKFQLETLFYAFYAMPQDALQAYAAQELYARDWRFHAELKLWFKRVTPADALAQPGVQYMYFDHNAWERRGFAGSMHMNIAAGLLSQEEAGVQFAPP